MERDFLADFLGVLERDLLDRLGVRGDEGDLKHMIRALQLYSSNHTVKQIVSPYLLDDFLLLDRGESLWEEREDVSLEYDLSERSDLSDRSERGEEDRPRLLLLRVGLGDPLWRRFLSTGGDKYLSDKKLNKPHVLWHTLKNL